MVENKTADTLGQEIQRLRTLAGITLRKLAELIDVSPAYVSDIEHDRRRPSADVLKRIAAELKHVGATYEALDKLNSRLDPDLQKWVSLTPAVRQMLREVKNSGRDPLDVVRQLQESAPKKKRRDA
jgi:transcriptional regulator with XRE-family HTH domain